MIAGDILSKRDGALNGLTVLVVEDEYYIADDVRRVLTAAGANVVGPISTLSEALDAAREGGFDCALIDLNLQGESAVPLADQLQSDRVPFAIATGYATPAVPEAYRDIPRIEKPFEPDTAIAFVSGLFPGRTA